MTIHQFLALCPVVQETHKGWDVCCPAHDDHDPSLGVMLGQDGRIVLHCLAHCTNQSILDVMGLEWTDLFPDSPITGQPRPLRLPPVKTAPRKLAFAYELHAFDLREAAQRILDVSGRCDVCETWTDEERAVAMKAVSRAYVYRERATFCEDYADHLREVSYVAS